MIKIYLCANKATSREESPEKLPSIAVVYHLQKKSGNFGWNVNGKTKLVFPNGKCPGKTGFLER